MNIPSSSPQRALNFEEFIAATTYLNQRLHPLVKSTFPHLQLIAEGVNENDEFVYRTTFEVPVTDEKAESLAYEMTIAQMCAILRGSSIVTTECLGRSHLEGFELCKFEIEINIPRHEVIRN